ncbi:putative Zn(2)-C6 fungal-type domain-containing protein [Seiridium unicorne]|uniref:Zn(2)-C6 fungal-type domain-containing protein n=1 Tax=Seiridium unicorne TaxID=138068 RepID=A0ABR2ULV4_9PEZI
MLTVHQEKVQLTSPPPRDLVGLWDPANASFDPFDSYPPTRLPRIRVQHLIHHFLAHISFQYYPLDLDMDSNPFVVSWWPLALADAALFHVSLQTASLDVERRGGKGFPMSELLMADSVTLLRQNVANLSLAFKNETLNSVVTLAAIEYGKGNVEASNMHIDGVKRMVSTRGGIHEIKRTSPLTARMISWVSMIVTGRPQFKVQDDSGSGEGIGPPLQWQLASTYPNPQATIVDDMGIDSAMSNILSRLRTIFHQPQSRQLTNMELHDLTSFILHRLLLLPPSFPADPRRCALSESLRHALVLYMLTIHGTTYYSHADLAKTMLAQLKTHLEALAKIDYVQSPLTVWILSVGMAASIGTPYRQWFMAQTCIATEALNLRTWNDIKTPQLGPGITGFMRSGSEPFVENATSLGLGSTSNRTNGLLPEYLSRWSNLQIVITVLLVLITYDQFRYIKQKGSIAGPRFKIPFMGPFIQALHPKFSAYLAQWASGPLSCVSVFHKFVVLASDRDIAHKVFKSPTYAKPCLVPIATEIMGPSSWVFLTGKAHAEFRRGLTGLFTNRALATYLPAQEKVYGDYFNRFVAASEANGGRPMAFMGLFREINCALSCRTFFGDYISEAAIKKIADDFYLVTAALELVNVPLSIYVPFTKPWQGKRIADAVLAEFTKCASVCKANMASGAEPTCIVDQWVSHMMESKKYNERIAAGEVGVEKPTNLIREFSDEEIGQTMFTFLFASQDASSSATTWLFQVLAQRPDVLDRLREENLAARSGVRNRPFELSMYDSLTYTNAVVKELLRHRPPVIFVPYLATKNFPVTPNYTVPKGAMIVPSCYPALHDPVAYPNPDVFDPDRWITGDAQSKTKNWLVFGTGAHDCLARSYVPLTMAAMIGKAALEIDWVHHATPRSEEIRVFATLFPMDECQLVFTKRK